MTALPLLLCPTPAGPFARSVVVAALVLGVLPVAARAQSAPARSTAPVPQGPHLGVLPAPVPDVLYEHLASLPRGRGVVVSEVVPDSPADRAKLQRHDILLSYDGKAIETCEQFARLLAADKPDRKVRLAVLRGGKPVAVDVTLVRGPVLTFGADHKDGPPQRGAVKQTQPGKVTVSASPQPDGTMTVTVEYYREGSSKLHTVTCTGTSEQIDSEINKLPQRVQDLARAALERIRALEAKDSPPRSSSYDRNQR